MTEPPKFHEIFTNITNNYRFIPFDKEVSPAAVRVPEAENEAEDQRPKLDHSTPLPEGYSGRITMHWVARTPVLFGGEQAGGITTPQKLNSGPNAPYCIPGSSLRGMIRRLLRIATKGKAQPVADSRPALRDPTYQKNQVHDGQGQMRPPKTGWLMFDVENTRWSLSPCEAIEIEHVDEDIAALNLAGSTDKDLRVLHSLLTSNTAQLDGGHLILTGGMGTRKLRELIFMPAADGAQPIPVGETSFNSFRQAYGKIDGGSKTARLLPESNLEAWLGHFLHKTNWSVEWRKALAEQFDLAWPTNNQQCPAGIRPDNPPGIPVYYYPEDTATSRRLVIGMSQIMRFPAKYTVHEVRDVTQPNREAIGRDWSEAMLGYVDGESKAALRGRIEFGFAKALGTPKMYPADGSFIKIVQGPPRPGFFTFYLRRTGQGGNPDSWTPATYDSAKGHLAGRKFYPAWNSAFEGWAKLPRWRTEQKKGEMDSLLQFLDRGTLFSARIDVHNLLPEELGALLWVLSLGDDMAFDAFDPAQPGERPYPDLAAYCHIAGRARSFAFGNLIPAGIEPAGVAAHSGSEPADPAQMIAAFACKLGAPEKGGVDDALDWLNRQPRLARLRHLSHREREPDTVGPKSPDPDLSSLVERDKKAASKRMFDDYKKLRNAASGTTPNYQVNRNLAASPSTEMGGNILDLGSDP